MNKPTATAVAGKFQSKDGSDLAQYLNSQGQVVLWINADGVLRLSTTAAQGAVQQMGLPRRRLSLRVRGHGSINGDISGNSDALATHSATRFTPAVARTDFRHR